MSVAETNARAFRLALAMDRMAEMRVSVGVGADEGFIFGGIGIYPYEEFDPASADSLAEAVARLWERREQRQQKEQGNADQEE